MCTMSRDELHMPVSFIITKTSSFSFRAASDILHLQSAMNKLPDDAASFSSAAFMTLDLAHLCKVENLSFFLSFFLVIVIRTNAIEQQKSDSFPLTAPLTIVLVFPKKRKAANVKEIFHFRQVRVSKHSITLFALRTDVISLIMSDLLPSSVLDHKK